MQRGQTPVPKRSLLLRCPSSSDEGSAVSNGRLKPKPPAGRPPPLLGWKTAWARAAYSKIQVRRLQGELDKLEELKLSLQAQLARAKVKEAAAARDLQQVEMEQKFLWDSRPA